MTIPHLGRILIVDDEVELMTALCESLTDQDYEALGRTSAHEALTLLQEQDIDLLVCDLMGRVPIFPVRLLAEPGAKWPYVSTGSTAPPCSTSARVRWPRHWHDTSTCSVLSSAG